MLNQNRIIKLKNPVLRQGLEPPAETSYPDVRWRLFYFKATCYMRPGVYPRCLMCGSFPELALWLASWRIFGFFVID